MDALTREAIYYAVTHGLQIVEKADAQLGTAISHAPMTPQPSPIDRDCFHLARKLAKPLNGMISRIAADRDYLREVLAETADADAEFTGRLFGLLDLGPPPSHGVELSILRHDFFTHKERDAPPALRMVEINCIATSCAGTGTIASRMHRFLAANPATGKTAANLADMPEYDAIDGLSRGLAAAHAAFINRFKPHQNMSVQAIMVVLPDESNIFDQELVRANLWAEHSVPMLRMSLADVGKYASLTKDGMLYVHAPNASPFLCSVAYFRAGYVPAHYPSELEWTARETIERSNAVKCPSIAVQLVGSKKMQQVLDQPGQVEKFVHNAQDAALIRSSFVRQYALSPGIDGDRAAKMALEQPDKFVLKPQREGGGNNLYASELKQALEQMSPKKRSAYILMERIKPVIVTNTVMRNGKCETGDVVSELGVYGIILTCNGQTVLNDDGGVLLRSKLAFHNDGGVAAGVAVLDSPLLC